MKILIVSDTHKNINLFEKVLSSEQSDILFHLGDYYEDSDKANFHEYSKTLYRVPGIYHPRYRDQSLPHCEALDLSGFGIRLIHNIDDMNFTNISDKIIFYGHTHVHKVHKYKSNILINPGHLKAMEDRNQPASYLVMRVIEAQLIIEMYQVEVGLVKTYKIRKEKDNKLELII